MWVCPKCNHKFYNENQSHSCVNYTVDDFLKNKSAKSIELFQAFLNAYTKIGHYELHPVKTRVALLTLMRFCSINKIGQDYIDGHLVLVEPYPDTLCFYKIDNLANRFYVHHFRIMSIDDINEELIVYMKKAYDVGERRHVRISKK
ncbi:MAG TPA: DUF5655 domain-containing protein [Saprospiraceae bacterium]|nr:DUF5655 domain-containing protein [Saprospiraceae bacterium]